MRYLSFIAIAALCLSTGFYSGPKKYTLHYDQEALRSLWGKLDTIQVLANAPSNMPHANVLYILQAVESIKHDINEQLKPQVDSAGRARSKK